MIRLLSLWVIEHADSTEPRLVSIDIHQRRALFVDFPLERRKSTAGEVAGSTKRTWITAQRRGKSMALMVG
jgi:hypothetical protein